MKTKFPTNLKFWIKSVFCFVLLYAIIWGIGYYRFHKVVENLQTKNQLKADRIEHCFQALKEGDSESKLKSILDISSTTRDGRLTKYFFAYDVLIQETSSVSNRMSKVFFVEVINEEIVKIEKQVGPITHGDRMMSLWRFYPAVCFFGLRTYEDE